mmetsp:Transcript_20615/g.43809  ORF Transcript_20615/g.43809 Transcript_20615/m.43809 type:complete len:553 (+) Transcript_20615:2-1660(+)
MYKKYAAFVQQTDTLWGFLTCRQHLMYATKLYQPEADNAEAVKTLLEELGLEGCQHVKAGNAFFKGISGGQKRRLSLGVALAKQPCVVFLDEPTSGLDAASAASIMKFLKERAPILGIAVLCTIHQPSTSVFEGFDKVCFLAGGKMTYIGPANELEDYLEWVGHPVPSSSNPADFMLDLTNRDFMDGPTVDNMLETWRLNAPALQRPQDLKLKRTSAPASVFGQICILFSRHLTLVIRDPLQYSARAILMLSQNCYSAILFIHTRDEVQDQAQPRMYLAMMLLVLPDVFCMVTTFTTYLDMQTIKREVKDGMYASFVYPVVQLVIQLPFMAVLSLFANVPAAYGLSNWPMDKFFHSVFIWSAKIWTMERLAMVCAIAAPDVLMGLMLFMNNWFTSFLFNGVVVVVEDVIWPFRLLTYVLPYRWATTAYVYMAFADATYNGTEICTLNATNSVPYCTPAVDDPGKGFYCPNHDQPACFGRTGKQVLSVLNAYFQSITPEEVWLDYTMVLILIGTVLTIFFFLGVSSQARAHSYPKDTVVSQSSESTQRATVRL